MGCFLFCFIGVLLVRIRNLWGCCGGFFEGGLYIGCGWVQDYFVFGYDGIDQGVWGDIEYWVLGGDVFGYCMDFVYVVQFVGIMLFDFDLVVVGGVYVYC